MKFTILVFLLLWLTRMTLSNGCFNPTNVVGTSAIIRLDMTDKPTSTLFPYFKWDIEVKYQPETDGNGSRIHMKTDSINKPLSIYMKNLQEWANYQVKITYIQTFWIDGKEYDYSRKVICEGNFTTVPRSIKVDHVYGFYQSYDHFYQAVGMAQIWDPQKFKFRFEWGPPESYEYTHFTRFKDLQGIGVAIDKFKYPYGILGPFRIRLVIKAKPPLVETYTSEPYIVYV